MERLHKSSALGGKKSEGISDANSSPSIYKSVTKSSLVLLYDNGNGFILVSLASSASLRFFEPFSTAQRLFIGRG